MAGKYEVTMKLDPSFDANIKKDPQYLASLRQLATGGVGIAQGLSPSRTGRWRSSIKVTGTTADDMGITANHRTWGWYEFGNYHLSPYAPFRGAIEQLGLQFQDTGR